MRSIDSNQISVLVLGSQCRIWYPDKTDRSILTTRFSCQFCLVASELMPPRLVGSDRTFAVEHFLLQVIQMWFFVQLCCNWQDFNWHSASRGPSALAELLVVSLFYVYWAFNDVSYWWQKPNQKDIMSNVLFFPTFQSRKFYFYRATLYERVSMRPSFIRLSVTSRHCTKINWSRKQQRNSPGSL